MSICLKCHRPIKDPIRWGGYGPICAKSVQPVHEVECDLLGFDIEAAVISARARVEEVISFRSALALHLTRVEFEDARQRLGVRP